MSTQRTHHQFTVLEGDVRDNLPTEPFTLPLGAHAGMAAWARLADKVAERLFGHRNVALDVEENGRQVWRDRTTGRTVLVAHQEVCKL